MTQDVTQKLYWRPFALAGYQAGGFRQTVGKMQAPVPLPGMTEVQGYRLPTALLSQMIYNTNMNEGRFDPLRTYFGVRQPAQGMSYQTDSVRKAYLSSLEQNYQNVNPYYQAKARQDELLTERNRLAAEPRKETRLASGEVVDAGNQPRLDELDRELEAQRQKMNSYGYRRAQTMDTYVRQSMGRHLDKLAEIAQTESNVPIYETVVKL